MCDKYLDRRQLKPLNINESIRMQPIQPNTEVWKQAKVTEKLNDHSYIVETENGRKYRRNREHLSNSYTPRSIEIRPSTCKEPTPSVPESTATTTIIEEGTPSSGKPTRTKSGRTVNKPLRYL